MAIAISLRMPVGMDVEHDRPLPDAPDIARHHFAPSEAELASATPSLFLPIWTAKEAVVKATGEGLGIGLSSFETRLIPGRFTPVRNLSDDKRLDGWFVLTLPEVVAGYHAAVAVRGPGWNVTLRRTDSTTIASHYGGGTTVGAAGRRAAETNACSR